MMVKALGDTINFDTTLSKNFYAAALFANPTFGAKSLDLDMLAKHGVIEHDVSLTRNDVSFGDNKSFNGGIWQIFKSQVEGKDTIDVPTASAARWHRLLACSEDHARQGTTITYGIKEMLFGYGESALYLSALGDAAAGQVPTKYLNALVGQ
jgi:hypothetical protein